MSVYHCLVLTRVGGVPQLRALACETDEEIPAAVAVVVREWGQVVRVDVFNAVEAVVSYDVEALRALSPRP